MSITSVFPSAAEPAADRKSGAAASVPRDDQRVLAQATKAAAKADAHGGALMRRPADAF